MSSDLGFTCGLVNRMVYAVSSRLHSERGVTLILTSMLVVVLLGVFSLSFFRTSITAVRTELQLATDAAAFAAVAQLCSTKSCWNDARAAAREVLAQHQVLGNLGESKSLALARAISLGVVLA